MGKEVEQCYDVTRTVCSESTEETTGKTVEISFAKECETMMVTVCEPGHGYGGYGHNYCKEVAQETCYNVPVVTVVEPAITVTYPEPVKTCVNKPISLPRISCEDITEEKCITVPEIEVVEEASTKCTSGLGEPNCQAVELTLPKQVCKEINYGHSLELEPAYAPAEPAPVPAYAEPAPAYA